MTAQHGQRVETSPIIYRTSNIGQVCVFVTDSGMYRLEFRGKYGTHTQMHFVSVDLAMYTLEQLLA